MSPHQSLVTAGGRGSGRCARSVGGPTYHPTNGSVMLTGAGDEERREREREHAQTSVASMSADEYLNEVNEILAEAFAEKS